MYAKPIGGVRNPENDPADTIDGGLTKAIFAILKTFNLLNVLGYKFIIIKDANQVLLISIAVIYKYKINADKEFIKR